MDKTEVESIIQSCSRFLTRHYRRTPRQVLSELAATTDPQLEDDRYGQGEIISSFETSIAGLLGKEAAVFMPSGTMCQQIALRIWAERRGTNNVAFHPTCHLEIHEQQAYQRLHNLHGILVGSSSRLLTLADLQAVAEPLGAVLIELPLREIGGQLPTWEELTALIAWTRERAIPTHLDGARLWECQPFYQRSYAEIAALFDSVYVSFYKILDGIAGSVLAGPADVIAEARTWQRRHGGNLVHLYPYVLSAQRGLEKHLGRIPDYCAKAREVAATLAQLPQIEIVPDPPQTNMMHVFLRGEADRLNAAALAVAQETGIWLFYGLAPTQLPNYHKLEFTVGEATLDLTNDEIFDLFARLFKQCE